MATQQEAADIAVLKAEMKVLKEAVLRIETKLDAVTANFITRGEFEEFKRRWFLSHTMAAMAGSIITGVIVYILTHVGHVAW